MNLAVNARDAMPGGGSMTFETHLRAGDDGERVCILVRDTGIGMDPGVQEQIFEAFFTTKAPGSGTGLGLSTVHGIVKEAGGEIEVQSRPGAGTTFLVYLPAMAEVEARTVDHEATEVDEDHDAAEVAAGPEDDQSGGETLLVVDDEAVIRHLLRSALEMQHYKVLVAKNGREALQVLGAVEAVDLVITDIVMPEMDGYALHAEVSRLYPDLKFIFVSGYPDQDPDRPSAPELSVEFVQKPFNFDELHAVILGLLDQVEANA